MPNSNLSKNIVYIKMVSTILLVPTFFLFISEVDMSFPLLIIIFAVIAFCFISNGLLLIKDKDGFKWDKFSVAQVSAGEALKEGAIEVGLGIFIVLALVANI